MKILCIAAHYDDAEIGCGGTLAKWSGQGHDVNIMVLTESGYFDESGKKIRDAGKAHEEGRSAARLLGAKLVEPETSFPVFSLSNCDEVRQQLIKAIKEMDIDTVLCHWDGDVHADHSSLAAATLMCARHVPRVLMYKSNYYDGTKPFNPSYYVDISGSISVKIDAIKKYESEFIRAGEKWIEYIKAQHRLNGLKVGVQYAEAFEAVRFLE